MKNTINLIAIIFLSSIILFTGCKKKDDDPGVDNEDQQRTRLAKTWIPEVPVTFNGSPSSGFADFEITFNSGGTYSSINGAPVFRTNGNWVFKENTNFSTIILDGRPELVISSLTEDKLHGTVNLEGGINARTTEIDGNYVFQLKVK